MPLAAISPNLNLDYEWVGKHYVAGKSELIVFLHEGLGSIALWKDFPQTLCAALNCSGLVYSRYGYGNSTPRPLSEAWQPKHLSGQADELAQLLNVLGIDTVSKPPLLFGHSDGGSIALVYAAKYARALSKCVVLAPHICVEQFSLDSIAKAKIAYETQGLRDKLKRFHADVDSAFYGWNDMWLSPAFAAENLDFVSSGLSQITAPILAIQGINDEYGTMIQIDGIAAANSNTTLCKIPNCGHSPHKDAPQTVITAVVDFINQSK